MSEMYKISKIIIIIDLFRIQKKIDFTKKLN